MNGIFSKGKGLFLQGKIPSKSGNGILIKGKGILRDISDIR